MNAILVLSQEAYRLEVDTRHCFWRILIEKTCHDYLGLHGQPTIMTECGLDDGSFFVCIVNGNARNVVVVSPFDVADCEIVYFGQHL